MILRSERYQTYKKCCNYAEGKWPSREIEQINPRRTDNDNFREGFGTNMSEKFNSPLIMFPTKVLEKPGVSFYTVINKEVGVIHS